MESTSEPEHWNVDWHALIWTNTALILLFLWTEYDWYLSEYSFAASVKQHSINSGESYVSFILRPEVLNSLAFFIDSSVKTFVSYAKIPLSIFWAWVAFSATKHCTSSYAALRFSGYIKYPDFLDSYLKLKKLEED